MIDPHELGHRSHDPAALSTFKVACEAVGITWLGFAIWHLLRTPFLLHRESEQRFQVSQAAVLGEAKKEWEQRVTSKEWLETSEKFRKWAGPPLGERAQYQSTRGVLTWYLHKSDLDSLCALTGAMLLKSPRIAATLSERVLAQKKHSDRWLTYLLERKGARDVGYAFETLDDGTPLTHQTGYLSDVGQMSVNVCTECSAEEI